jgi:hypothetical protein
MLTKIMRKISCFRRTGTLVSDSVMQILKFKMEYTRTVYILGLSIASILITFAANLVVDAVPFFHVIVEIVASCEALMRTVFYVQL